MENLNIERLHTKLTQKEISATEVARAFLKRLEEKDKLLNAFITQTPELALQQAAATDKLIARGEELPPLAGVPCVVKDSILLKGVRCTAGSKILKEYVAPYDATVVKRIRAQGALFLGKTNTDEFSMGASTEHSAFGVTKNPHDTSRVAGGSSGGSAASVAAGQALLALGADTGGSIRLPAAFCGVVGVKPTYGAVSRYGLIAMASSLDQIGPLAKTAQDAEIGFQAMCGRDKLDATSFEYQYKPFANFTLQDVRIGMPKEFFSEGLSPQMKEHVQMAIQKLEKEGASVMEISLPHAKYALAAYYILNTSEVSSNLARYDGIRYGASQNSTGSNVIDVYLQSRGEYLGQEVKRRIMLGTYALSAGYYDAYYLKAQKVRTLLKKDFDDAFRQVDVIAGPPSPLLPFKIGERAHDPLAMYLVDLYTVPVNLVGLPALSMPVGFADKLPVGLQLIGRPFEENLLFALAKNLEKLV